MLSDSKWYLSTDVRSPFGVLVCVAAYVYTQDGVPCVVTCHLQTHSHARCARKYALKEYSDKRAG